jgi:hypothetical protein
MYPPTQAPTPGIPQDTSNQLSAAATVGIVFGATVGAFLLVGFAFWIYRFYYKSATLQENTLESPLSATSRWNNGNDNDFTTKSDYPELPRMVPPQPAYSPSYNPTFDGGAGSQPNGNEAFTKPIPPYKSSKPEDFNSML